LFDHSETEEDILGLSITKASLTRKKNSLNCPGTHQPGELKSPKLPKALFLSTWRGPTVPGHSAPHASIHHFCTETHGPQLPPQLAMVSKSAHSNKYPKYTHSAMSTVDGYGEEKNKDEKKEDENIKDKPHKIRENSLDNIEKRWDLVREEAQNIVHKEDQRDFVIPQLHLESSSSIKSQKSAGSERKKSSRARAVSAYASCRYEASPLDSTSNLHKDNTDRLISTARERLRKELKESERVVSPSEALGVVGAKDVQIESLLKKLQSKSAQRTRSSGYKKAVEKTDIPRNKEREKKTEDKKKVINEEEKETSNSRTVSSKVIKEDINFRGEENMEVTFIPHKNMGNFKEKVTK